MECKLRKILGKTDKLVFYIKIKYASKFINYNLIILNIAILI